MNKLLKSKRFKYGSIATILTIVFVALVIVLNVVISALDAKYNLTFDLTETNLYTVSDSSKEILDSLGDDLDITIYFLAERDTLDSSYETYLVRELAEEYERNYPGKIKVDYININKNPSFADKYMTESTITSIGASNVIVEGKHHFRLLSINAFYSVDSETSEIYAFNGELRFTAAMTQSSIKEQQIVTFTTGHGEDTANLTGTVSAANKPALRDIFETAGFDIRVVDLEHEEIDDNTRILIINNPKSDFSDFDKENPSAATEIDKISAYMAKYRGLMVFVDSSTPSLPNLQEYLLEHWGVTYEPYSIISDIDHCVKAGSPGESADGLSVVAQYSAAPAEGQTAAYKIHERASSAGIKSVFRNAVRLSVDTNKGQQGVVVNNVVSTSAGAKATNPDTGEETTGVFPLMTISSKMTYVDNNATWYQYCVISSSSEFANNTFLSPTYGNSEFIYGATRLMSTERSIPDITYKKFNNENKALEIEDGTARRLAIGIIFLLPVAIIICGVVTFVRRRHR